MKTRSRWLVAAILIVTGSFSVLAQTGSKGGEIEYRLKWLANAGFAGDLYASAYGYYSNAGLKVSVTPGGPNRDALTAMLTPGSKTLFAVASADQVLQAVYRGSTDVRVIAQFYAANPVQWIYRSSIGPIDTPAKLKGKKIGVAIGDNDETLMKAYLENNGIALSDVTLVGIQFDYAPFLTGSVDLFPVYTNTQGVELRRQMKKENTAVSFFDPSRVGTGVQFVANSLVTTSRTIREQRDVVVRFVDATLKGWSDAIEPANRDRAAQAIVAAVGQSVADVDAIKEQIDETRPLIKPSPTHGVGTIDLSGWRQTEATMFNGNLLKRPDGQKPPQMVGIEPYLDAQFLSRR